MAEKVYDSEMFSYWYILGTRVLSVQLPDDSKFHYHSFVLSSMMDCNQNRYYAMIYGPSKFKKIGFIPDL
jgi:hypothetical protein